MSAAALSATVDSLNANGDTPNSQAEPTPKKQPPQTPAALREKGSGEEGKDSHSRQWRLSMAVFLNRNKRPLAAPIEVAELLPEKRPPPQNLAPTNLFGREREGGASLREAAFLASPHTFPSIVRTFAFLFLLYCEIYTYNLHSGVAKRLFLSYNRGAEQARRIPWISVKP